MKTGDCGGNFSAAVRAENNSGYIAVIPDIKRVSPKEGELMPGRDPAEAAKELVSFGAPARSVVTESARFGGSEDMLRAVVRNVNVPVLRKDFITSGEQLIKTAGLGAAAVLLICAVTDEKKLCMLYEKSLELGLEPFVETCTAAEVALAKKLGAQLIGINNRDILTLERDDGGPSRTAELASGISSGAVLVSESGILSSADAEAAAAAGANAVLAGTAIWKSNDIRGMYNSLRVKFYGR
ncbi:MAG: indole-3-glycerol-phosphate synthase [Oscillospiraceae bacterium]|nr:indole-3-glycerol-phosphate synthase [Oscillospiraceae bacterium]